MRWKEFSEIAKEMHDMCLDNPTARYSLHYENTEERFNSFVNYFIVKLRLLLDS